MDFGSPPRRLLSLYPLAVLFLFTPSSQAHSNSVLEKRIRNLENRVKMLEAQVFNSKTQKSSQTGLKVKSYGGNDLKSGSQVDPQSDLIEQIQKTMNLSEDQKNSLMEALKNYGSKIEEKNRALEEIDKVIDNP